LRANFFKKVSGKVSEANFASPKVSWSRVLLSFPKVFRGKVSDETFEQTFGAKFGGPGLEGEAPKLSGQSLPESFQGKLCSPESFPVDGIAWFPETLLEQSFKGNFRANFRGKVSGR
jgi:hypothetical protein